MFDNSLGNIGTFGAIAGVITLFINGGTLIINYFSVARVVKAAKEADFNKKVDEKDHKKDLENMEKRINTLDEKQALKVAHLKEKATSLEQYIRDVETRNKSQHDDIRADYVRGIKSIADQIQIVITLIEAGKHGK